MSVEVWYGEKPHHETEQRILLELYQYLGSQQEHFVLLHNFFAGQSNEIDLVALKCHGVFLAELKHVWGRLVGGREGDWIAINEDGSQVTLNPDRPNPFKQAQRNYHCWKNWCHDHTTEISAGVARTCLMDWANVMTYVVLYPDLPPDSQIDIGERPVRAVGLPTFLMALTMRTSEKVDLSPQEMSHVPKLIGLKRWQLSQPTEKLQEWQPAPFAVLVARGHALSVPLFRLDEINKDVITVGRVPENDLIISDPTVSRHHAEIYRSGKHWVVRDLKSTSGTFVSYAGEPTKESPVVERDFALKNSSIVRFGPAAYTLLVYDGEVK